MSERLVDKLLESVEPLAKASMRLNDSDVTLSSELVAAMARVTFAANVIEKLEEALFWIVGNSDLTGEINQHARAALSLLRGDMK